jgi:arginase family enzyme
MLNHTSRETKILIVPQELGVPYEGGGLGSRLLAKQFHQWYVKQGEHVSIHTLDILPESYTEVEILLFLKKTVETLLSSTSRIWCFTACHSFTPALTAALRSTKGDCGLVWLDAHADFNTTTTSETGQLHGMGLALATGCEAPGCSRWEYLAQSLNEPRSICNAITLGVRDLSVSEKAGLNEKRIPNISVDSIMVNAERAGDDALRHVQHCPSLCISFDIDFVDANILPGTASPGWFGPGCVETGLILRKLLTDTRPMIIEVTEYNPAFDCQRYGLHQITSMLKYAAQEI